MVSICDRYLDPETAALPIPKTLIPRKVREGIIFSRGRGGAKVLHFCVFTFVCVQNVSHGRTMDSLLFYLCLSLVLLL